MPDPPSLLALVAPADWARLANPVVAVRLSGLRAPALWIAEALLAVILPPLAWRPPLPLDFDIARLKSLEAATAAARGACAMPATIQPFSTYVQYVCLLQMFR